MADEKCILDPYRDCLGLEKARQLEKIIDRHLNESDRTHQDLLKRLELLEKGDAKREERDEHIMEKLDGLGIKSTDSVPVFRDWKSSGTSARRSRG